jgi:simple sugar transport system permease protein
MLAGLAGAYLSVAQLSMYSDGMVAGRGFIALAAMIFGKRRPIGCLLAGLLFGFAEALQMTLQAVGVPVPSDFLLMSPYIVTLVVLVLFVGKTIDPGANGKPYVKG